MIIGGDVGPVGAAVGGELHSRAARAGLDAVVEIQRRLVLVGVAGQAEGPRGDRLRAAGELQRHRVGRGGRGLRQLDQRVTEEVGADRRDRRPVRNPGARNRHPQAQLCSRGDGDERRTVERRCSGIRQDRAGHGQVCDRRADVAFQIGGPGLRHDAQLRQCRAIGGDSLAGVEPKVDADVAVLLRDVLVDRRPGIPRMVQSHRHAVAGLRAADGRGPPQIDVDGREGEPGEVARDRVAGIVHVTHPPRGTGAAVEGRDQRARRIEAPHGAAAVDGEEFVGEIAGQTARTAGHVLRADRQPLEIRIAGDPADQRRGCGIRVDREQVAPVIDAVERASHERHAGRQAEVVAGGLDHAIARAHAAVDPTGRGVAGGLTGPIEPRHARLVASCILVADRIEEPIEGRHVTGPPPPGEGIDLIRGHGVAVGNDRVGNLRERGIREHARLRDRDVRAPGDCDRALHRHRTRRRRLQ